MRERFQTTGEEVVVEPCDKFRFVSLSSPVQNLNVYKLPFFKLRFETTKIMSSNTALAYESFVKFIFRKENCEQLTTVASDTRPEKIFSSDRHFTAV